MMLRWGEGAVRSGAPLVKTEGKKVYVGAKDKPGKLDKQRWETEGDGGVRERSLVLRMTWVLSGPHCETLQDVSR